MSNNFKLTNLDSPLLMAAVENSVPARFRLVREVSRPIWLGIVPFNRVIDTSNSSRLVSRDHPVGRPPVKLLPATLRDLRAVSAPKWEGRVWASALLLRSIAVKDAFNAAMALGMVPLRFRPLSDIRVTKYVAGAVGAGVGARVGVEEGVKTPEPESELEPSSHVIPFHPHQIGLVVVAVMVAHLEVVLQPSVAPSLEVVSPLPIADAIAHNARACAFNVVTLVVRTVPIKPMTTAL